MPTYHSIPKPTTPYQNVRKVGENHLLISPGNFLLINSNGDRLLINETRDADYTDISKPAVPSYHSIPKPS